MNSGWNQIICIGGATIDRKYHALTPTRRGTSNPVRGDRGFGGVARNVAENLARLRLSTALVTLVGDDDSGRAVVAHLQQLGVDTHRIRSLRDEATAEYVAVLEPNGDLALGVADMRIFEAFRNADLDGIEKADWIFADCNLPAGMVQSVVGLRRRHGFRLAMDAVSVPKARRLPADLSGIDLLLLNQDEAGAFLGNGPSSALDKAAALLERGASQVIVTSGPDDLVVGAGDTITSLPVVEAHPVDVTGAGDSLVAAVLCGLSNGLPLRDAAQLGALAAALTLESPTSVRCDLSPDLLKSAMHRLANTA